MSRQSDNATKGNVVEANEIKKCFHCCYVSTSEAMWRIFKFDMHEQFPFVEFVICIIKYTHMCIRHRVHTSNNVLENWLHLTDSPRQVGP
jgi:hypothetical protein